MTLDDLSAQRKANAAPRHVLAMQALEVNMRSKCSRAMPIPFIGDGEPVLAVRRLGRNLNVRRGISAVVDRVHHQVLKHLKKAHRVGLPLRQSLSVTVAFVSL